MIEINDRSRNRIYSSNMELIDNFTDYSSKNLDFDKPVEVEFLDDEENAKNPLGTTAHYNPDEMKITIYVTGRHLKDILRSISHELIHHVQNCRGDLDHGINKLGYAQDDKHMRGMEHEAYTMGNIMIFRDFEDNYKRGKKMPAKNKLSKLKEMIKKGVEEVINEQSSEIGVGAGVKRIGGSGRGFDLGRDWNPKREQLKGGNVQQLSQFILDKQNDAFISNDEMTVMYLGTLKVIQKGKICALTKLLEKGTYTSKAGYNRGRQVPIDIDYLVRQFKNTTFLKADIRNMRRKFIGYLIRGKKCEAKPSPSPTPSGGGGQTVDPTLGLPCVDKCPQGSGAGSLTVGTGGYDNVCLENGKPVAILRKGNENHPSCRKGGGGKKRSKRCPRNITIQIQKKLNELGYKLKPTRRAPDGVDGNFGKNTYDNLVKALGKKVVGRNRFVASRNCKKLLGLLQNVKPNPSPTPSPTPTPTPDRGLGRQPGMPIGGIVDKAIAPIVSSYNKKIVNKILELNKAGKLTPENQKNIRTLNITLRGLRTQLRSLIMKTMRLERSNLLTDDGKEYSQNKVTARAKELANKYFSPLMDAPNKLGDANYVAQLVQRLRNIEKTTLRESVKFDLNSFTEELNDYKNEKQDQSFKKLVEGIKK